MSLEGAVTMFIKTSVQARKPHLHRTVKILKQAQSSNAMKEKIESAHFFEANTSYLFSIKGFLLS